MRPEDLRAFAWRDWPRVARAKREHWATATTPAEALRVADALRAHVSRFAADALDAERADDLAHHVLLKRRIDAASARLCWLAGAALAPAAPRGKRGLRYELAPSCDSPHEDGSPILAR